VRFIFILSLICTWHSALGQLKFFYSDAEAKHSQEQFRIQSLKESRHLFHFRYSDYNRAIDLWTDDYKVFGGSVSFSQEDNAGESFGQTFPIAHSTAKTAYHLVKKSLILIIPTAEGIKGWRGFFDTYSIAIEHSTPSFYSYKRYCCPDEYHQHVREARFIAGFVEELNTLSEIRSCAKTFYHSLPEGWYRTAGLLSTWIGKRPPRYTKQRYMSPSTL
jgi:hypothetical protein